MQVQLTQQLAWKHAEVFSQQLATVSTLERCLRDREQEVATLRKRLGMVDAQKGVESQVMEEKKSIAALTANEDKWDGTLKQLQVN